ncbi:MFS transporter [Streptosporangium sp. NPDC051022]|uniref:MFS transporter n=1 Tax=Streptosporangium sp. NPDC051022 TaxID=3155752 RepID=UPI0034275C43
MRGAFVVGPYRKLFSRPGVKGFVVAGFFGRMPMSMLGIGVVLLIEALTDSYAMAGAVAATVNVAFAIAGPLTGRLVDRFGQARVAVPFVLTHGAALTAMMLCGALKAPAWTLFATGVVVGGSALSLGSLVRARWSHLLGGSSELHVAFSFESIVDEIIFVAGPALVTALATTVSPYAGLIVAMVSTVIGTIAFAMHRGTEPPITEGGGRSGSPITIPGVALLSCVFLAMGSVFGSFDLITVAFAEEHGSMAASGLLLSVIACGSLISGLWYGARKWKVSLRSRFVRALGVFVLGISPFSLIDDIGVMVPFMFLAGLAISPTVITSYTLIEQLVPARLLTEGMSWLSTAIGFGVALGSWAAGRLTDTFGASNSYLLPLGFALVAVIVGVGGSVWLRTPVPQQQS